MSEIIDLYDYKRAPLHKQVVRYTPLNKGEYRLVVHCVIFNSKGELLIQQRSSSKHGWPNLWDITCGGQVSSGEDSQTAMNRELKEELGIDINFEGVPPFFTYAFEDGFDDVYMLEKDIDLKDIVMQESEVQNVRYASIEEISKMIDDGTFIYYVKEYIPFLWNTFKSGGYLK